MRTETPLLAQYWEMKKKHPDAILLFRVGDFYETFSEDAVIASKILGLTLTRRQSGVDSRIELAGFPHHALDTYLPKLVRAGKRVAICEQLEDPKLSKKLVKRGIQPSANIDLSLVTSFLSLFRIAMEQLYKLSEINRKTAEIRTLSKELGISPKFAFKTCLGDSNQLSLF